jgi:hypothetical protein
MRNYRANAQQQIGMRKSLGFLSPQTPFGMTVFGPDGYVLSDGHRPVRADALDPEIESLSAGEIEGARSRMYKLERTLLARRFAARQQRPKERHSAEIQKLRAVAQ